MISFNCFLVVISFHLLFHILCVLFGGILCMNVTFFFIFLVTGVRFIFVKTLKKIKCLWFGSESAEEECDGESDHACE